MKNDEFTWGEFETRSIVNRHEPVKMNYAPEIEADLDNYTWGEFETRSIVHRHEPVRMHAVRPCLKLTLGMSDGAKLTHERATQEAATWIQAVIDGAPQDLHHAVVKAAFAVVEEEMVRDEAEFSRRANGAGSHLHVVLESREADEALSRLHSVIARARLDGVFIVVSIDLATLDIPHNGRQSDRVEHRPLTGEMFDTVFVTITAIDPPSLTN